MLYERWRQIAQNYREEIALREFVTGKTFTFGELDALSETGTRPQEPIAFPQGSGAVFILESLQAWRRERVLCPLETGQPLPDPRGELPREIVHLKLTSATSRAARLVAFTAPQLMADADNIVATMGLRRDWPNLAVISLAHSYGFSNLVLPLLLHGIPLILVESALPEIVRRAAGGQGAVTLAAVPALWRAWHEADAIMSNVRLAISAGAPLPLSLEQSVFARNGLKIHNFYGSSECGGIAYDASAVARADGSCAGTPLKNVAVAIGPEGCLEVSGPAVGQTYWPEPEPSLGQGVFRTSDLAEIADGVIHLRGRATDQINVAGRKVPPETIEKVLMTHPQVLDCLVFGIPSLDVQRVEEIVACLVMRERIATEALRQFLLARLPAWQVPREWQFVESLGVNDRGKISRVEWRKRFLSERRNFSDRAAEAVKPRSR